MTDRVEAVARWLRDLVSLYMRSSAKWDDLPESARDVYRTDARSLLALLEPSLDSQRLDWLENIAFGTGKALTLGGSCYWSVSLGRKRLGEGDDLREAIDAGIHSSEQPVPSVAAGTQEEAE